MAIIPFVNAVRDYGTNFAGSLWDAYKQAASGAWDQEANAVERSPFVQNFETGSYLNSVRSNRGGAAPAYSPPLSASGFGNVSHAGEPSSAASGGVYNQPGGDWTRPFFEEATFQPPPVYQFGSSYQPLQLPLSDQETDGVSIGFGSRAYPLVDNYPVSPNLSPTEWFDALLRGIRNRGLAQSGQQNSQETLLSSIFGNGGT